jgi:hypothetical protein
MNINFDLKTGQPVVAKNPTDDTIGTDHKGFLSAHRYCLAGGAQ